MKINHNDSAVITNVKLLRNETFLTESMERLSSGFKINHASDNPSGMAISNKMQAQINGLSQASRNSSDGLSVLETADGTMQELTNILQRIRELAVQAANDSNSNSDRDAVQTEIDELTREIDRVAASSEFNTKSLLNGSLDTHSYGDFMSRRHISDGVQEGVYKMTVDKAATQATANLDLSSFNTFPIPGDAGVHTFRINDSIFTITPGMTRDEFNDAFIKGCERGDIIAVRDAATGNVTGELISMDYGRDAKIAMLLSEETQNLVGLAGENLLFKGEDAEISLDPDSAFKDHPHADIKQFDNRIRIVDSNGFEIDFKVDDKYEGDLELEVTNLGPMDIQVGANANQQIPVRIPSVSIDDLYMDKINVGTFVTASKAIEACDKALSYLSTARARVGAYSNRLEHTVLSTDNTEENMTSAISRIKDVDMAEEMTEYTKQNVLVQAATSALSQANEIPQMALQLLQ